MLGGSGEDILQASSGNNRLAGGADDDTLIGANGKDVLNGGSGRDILTGGGGSDVFVFGDKFGENAIMDFEFAKSCEVIDLSAATGIESYEDLVASHLFEFGRGVGTLINDGEGTSMSIWGVRNADLSEDDFIF